MNRVKNDLPLIYFDANKISNDLKKAVYARLRQFGKSFWTVGFEPWVHPYNEVRNCLALTLDGFIYYKFQVMMIRSKKGYYLRFRIAKMPPVEGSFIMDVKKNQRLSFAQLMDKISTANVD
jgi:hypothetical protein